MDERELGGNERGTTNLGEGTRSARVPSGVQCSCR